MMNKQQDGFAVNALCQGHQMTGGPSLLFSRNMLAVVAQAIVVQQVGSIVENEFISKNFYSFDYKELNCRNQIKYQLID